MPYQTFYTIFVLCLSKNNPIPLYTHPQFAFIIHSKSQNPTLITLPSWLFCGYFIPYQQPIFPPKSHTNIHTAQIWLYQPIIFKQNNQIRRIWVNIKRETHLIQTISPRALSQNYTSSCHTKTNPVKQNWN